MGSNEKTHQMVGFFVLSKVLFIDVRRDLFGHLHHINVCAAENLTKFRVWANHAFLLRILEIIGLNVVPELLCDLCARHRPLADYLLELRRDVYRL
jgi:hypothetical protein